MATNQTTVVNLIIAAMQYITTVHEYSFNINTAYIFNHRAAEIDTADWSVSIYDNEDEVNTENDIDHALSIQIILSGHPANVAELRTKMQDIITAMYTIEGNAPVDYINFENSNKFFDQEEEKIGEAEFNFTVYYKCDRGKM